MLVDMSVPLVRRLKRTLTVALMLTALSINAVVAEAPDINEEVHYSGSNYRDIISDIEKKINDFDIKLGDELPGGPIERNIRYAYKYFTLTNERGSRGPETMRQFVIDTGNEILHFVGTKNPTYGGKTITLPTSNDPSNTSIPIGKKIMFELRSEDAQFNVIVGNQTYNIREVGEVLMATFNGISWNIFGPDPVKVSNVNRTFYAHDQEALERISNTDNFISILKHYDTISIKATDENWVDTINLPKSANIVSHISNVASTSWLNANISALSKPSDESIAPGKTVIIENDSIEQISLSQEGGIFENISTFVLEKGDTVKATYNEEGVWEIHNTIIIEDAVDPIEYTEKIKNLISEEDHGDVYIVVPANFSGEAIVLPNYRDVNHGKRVAIKNYSSTSLYIYVEDQWLSEHQWAYYTNFFGAYGRGPYSKAYERGNYEWKISGKFVIQDDRYTISELARGRGENNTIAELTDTDRRLETDIIQIFISDGAFTNKIYIPNPSRIQQPSVDKFQVVIDVDSSQSVEVLHDDSGEIISLLEKGERLVLQHSWSESRWKVVGNFTIRKQSNIEKYADLSAQQWGELFKTVKTFRLVTSDGNWVRKIVLPESLGENYLNRKFILKVGSTYPVELYSRISPTSNTFTDDNLQLISKVTRGNKLELYWNGSNWFANDGLFIRSKDTIDSLVNDPEILKNFFKYSNKVTIVTSDENWARKIILPFEGIDDRKHVVIEVNSTLAVGVYDGTKHRELSKGDVLSLIYAASAENMRFGPERQQAPIQASWIPMQRFQYHQSLEKRKILPKDTYDNSKIALSSSIFSVNQSKMPEMISDIKERLRELKDSEINGFEENMTPWMLTPTAEEIVIEMHELRYDYYRKFFNAVKKYHENRRATNVFESAGQYIVGVEAELNQIIADTDVVLADINKMREAELEAIRAAMALRREKYENQVIAPALEEFENNYGIHEDFLETIHGIEKNREVELTKVHDLYESDLEGDAQELNQDLDTFKKDFDGDNLSMPFINMLFPEIAIGEGVFEALENADYLVEKIRQIGDVLTGKLNYSDALEAANKEAFLPLVRILRSLGFFGETEEVDYTGFTHLQNFSHFLAVGYHPQKFTYMPDSDPYVKQYMENIIYLRQGFDDLPLVWTIENYMSGLLKQKLRNQAYNMFTHVLGADYNIIAGVEYDKETMTKQLLDFLLSPLDQEVLLRPLMVSDAILNGRPSAFIYTDNDAYILLSSDLDATPAEYFTYYLEELGSMLAWYRCRVRDIKNIHLHGFMPSDEGARFVDAAALVPILENDGLYEEYLMSSSQYSMSAPVKIIFSDGSTAYMNGSPETWNAKIFQDFQDKGLSSIFIAQFGVEIPDKFASIFSKFVFQFIYQFPQMQSINDPYTYDQKNVENNVPTAKIYIAFHDEVNLMAGRKLKGDLIGEMGDVGVLLLRNHGFMIPLQQRQEQGINSPWEWLLDDIAFIKDDIIRVEAAFKYKGAAKKIKNKWGEFRRNQDITIPGVSPGNVTGISMIARYPEMNSPGGVASIELTDMGGDVLPGEIPTEEGDISGGGFGTLGCDNILECYRSKLKPAGKKVKKLFKFMLSNMQLTVGIEAGLTLSVPKKNVTTSEFVGAIAGDVLVEILSRGIARILTEKFTFLQGHTLLVGEAIAGVTGVGLDFFEGLAIPNAELSSWATLTLGLLDLNLPVKKFRLENDVMGSIERDAKIMLTSYPRLLYPFANKTIIGERDSGETHTRWGGKVW